MSSRPRRLRRPLDRRVLQPSFDQFASQPIGVLTNRWVRRELMLVRSISLDLLSNVFVEMREPLVGHMFDTHNLPLLLLVNSIVFPLRLPKLDQASTLVGFFVCFLDTLLVRRSQLAGEPAHGVGLQRVDGKGNFLDVMAGAALERTLLKAPFAGRNSSQSHPVFASETHRPFDN